MTGTGSVKRSFASPRASRLRPEAVRAPCTCRVPARMPFGLDCIPDVDDEHARSRHELWVCTGKLVLYRHFGRFFQITSLPRSTWISYSGGFDNFTMAGAVAVLCARHRDRDAVEQIETGLLQLQRERQRRKREHLKWPPRRFSGDPNRLQPERCRYRFLVGRGIDEFSSIEKDEIGARIRAQFPPTHPAQRPGPQDPSCGGSPPRAQACAVAGRNARLRGERSQMLAGARDRNVRH